MCQSGAIITVMLSLYFQTLVVLPRRGGRSHPGGSAVVRVEPQTDASQGRSVPACLVGPSDRRPLNDYVARPCDDAGNQKGKSAADIESGLLTKDVRYRSAEYGF